MNRVYKLVWNRARNMYIAVSDELKFFQEEVEKKGIRVMPVWYSETELLQL